MKPEGNHEALSDARAQVNFMYAYMGKMGMAYDEFARHVWWSSSPF